MSKLFDTKQEIERLLYNRRLRLEYKRGEALLRDVESGETIALDERLAGAGGDSGDGRLGRRRDSRRLALCSSAWF